MLQFVWLLVAFHLSSPSSADSSQIFYLKASTSYGPKRLPGAGPAPSLISCVASCMSRFPEECQSVLYNEQTQLCSPGQLLAPTEPPPRADEGDLYITHQCNSTPGFSTYTYGATSACLFYDLVQKNYTDARSNCESLDSSLATIFTADKFYLIQKMFQEPIWLGLNDMGQEGVYVWSDGTVNDMDFTKFMFEGGEPNDYGTGEDCISMFWPKPAKLNDDDCGKTYSSVCDKIY